MADEKVTKMEHVDNRPRITLEEAAQRIDRVVCRLNLLLESVFAKDDPDLRKAYRLFIERRNNGHSGARVSFLGFAEGIINNSYPEIEEVYLMLYPEFLEEMGTSLGTAKGVRSLPPYDDSDYPDMSCSLYVPLTALAGLDSRCNSNECELVGYSDSAFRGFGFVVEDVRDALVSCLDAIAAHEKKSAA